MDIELNNKEDKAMKTFKDLEFTPWAGGLKGDDVKHALLLFDNGYGVSVLLGGCFYSNGIDTYELAVIWGTNEKYRITYGTPVTNDVLSYITEEEVTEAMIKIQSLEKIK